MKKHNQKGLAHLATFLFLIIFGLIGFTAWYVLHSKNQTEKNYSTASNTSQNAANSGLNVFTGKVSAINSDCASDGLCTVFINGKAIEVITGGGKYASATDNVWGTTDSAIKVGDTVSVKAIQAGGGTFTLQRCASCYIKKASN